MSALQRPCAVSPKALARKDRCSSRWRTLRRPMRQLRSGDRLPPPSEETQRSGNGDSLCLSQAKRAGGGVSAIRLRGSDTACPPGFTLGQNSFSGGCRRHCGQCEPGYAEGLAWARAGWAARTCACRLPQGLDPGSGCCRIAALSASFGFRLAVRGLLGVSFAGVTGGGRINCLAVITPRRAGELGLQSAGGCPAGSVAVEDDNPASVGQGSHG